MTEEGGTFAVEKAGLGKTVFCVRVFRLPDQRQWNLHKVLLVHLESGKTNAKGQLSTLHLAQESYDCTHHTLERISSPVQVEDGIINRTIVSASKA